MNLALSDEQVFLREAARGALSRFKTLEAARAALDGERSALPDLWPTSCEAGWPGLLIDEACGGAGLDAFEAMLVLEECGRVLAAHALLGHLPATAILNDAKADDALLQALASGERRAAYLPSRPADDVREQWTVDRREGMERPPVPSATRSGAADGQVLVSGEVAFVPDAPGADVYVGVALLDGQPVGVAIEAPTASSDAAAGASTGGAGASTPGTNASTDGTGASTPGTGASTPGTGASSAQASGRVSVEPVFRYDATRSLGHLTLKDAPATLLAADRTALESAWHLAQALIAAESLGSVQSALDVSVAYAKERFTFGRAIGSYQVVKHSLTEVLRQLENGRSLLYYAGWSRRGRPDEFALAANAARSVAGGALDYAARTMISVHGGIGATWEHDAPLYFRRAQLTRRLLGGTASATDRVACELIAQAA